MPSGHAAEVTSFELTRSHPPTRWPDPKKGPCSLSFWWQEIDGQIECVGVELFVGCEHWRERTDDGRFEETIRQIPGATPEALTAREYRSVPISTLIVDARKQLRDLFAAGADRIEELGDEKVAQSLRNMSRKYEAANSNKGRGRPPLYGPEFFKEVADVYIEACNYGSGQKRKALTPRQAVVTHFGTNASTASRWIAKAREEGLLKATKPGRAGWLRKPQPPARKTKT